MSTPHEALRMKRPIGVTLLAVYLGLLALQQLSHWRTDPFWPPQDPKAMVTLLRTATAIAAGVAAFGLWRMRPWATTAVAAFAGTVIATLVIQQSLLGSGWTLGVVFVTVVWSVLVLSAVAYVRRTAGRHRERISG